MALCEEWKSGFVKGCAVMRPCVEACRETRMSLLLLVASQLLESLDEHFVVTPMVSVSRPHFFVAPVRVAGRGVFAFRPLCLLPFSWVLLA